MSAATNMNTYLNNHYQGKTPEQLIQMLYKGALRNISLAKQGIDENNPRKRGEHLGKAIAIITELYTSLDTEIKDESIQFLRELYSNMLTELPKVSLNNDAKALDLTYSYIKQLNHIWETEVLNKEGGQSGYEDTISKQDNSPPPRSLFA
ncbi:MAG: flagellar export chaperone FliS [Desulfobacteraceae bacterium]|nr:flagellar export chaperone FliS [Desulfobacteraceae bacterium]